MSKTRKKWTGDPVVKPESPDLVLARLTGWIIDNSKKYSTLNGYEPNNLTAAAAWKKLPNAMIEDDAFIYRDRKTKLWIQAVGYPIVPVEQTQSWVDKQISAGAIRSWTNPNAHPRLPQKPYTLREYPGQSNDPITYIEIIADQNKFTVNGINLLELNPRGKPKEVDIHTPVKPRKTYTKRDPTKFYVRKNSRFVETPSGVFQSITEAAEKTEISFCGITYHIRKKTPGYRLITMDEYLDRIKDVNNDEATE